MEGSPTNHRPAPQEVGRNWVPPEDPPQKNNNKGQHVATGNNLRKGSLRATAGDSLRDSRRRRRPGRGPETHHLVAASPRLVMIHPTRLGIRLPSRRVP